MWFVFVKIFQDKQPSNDNNDDTDELEDRKKDEDSSKVISDQTIINQL